MRARCRALASHVPSPPSRGRRPAGHPWRVQPRGSRAAAPIPAEAARRYGDRDGLCRAGGRRDRQSGPRVAHDAQHRRPERAHGPRGRAHGPRGGADRRPGHLATGRSREAGRRSPPLVISTGARSAEWPALSLSKGRNLPAQFHPLVISTGAPKARSGETSPPMGTRFLHSAVLRTAPVEMTRGAAVLRTAPVEMTRGAAVLRTAPVEMTRGAAVLRTAPVEMTRGWPPCCARLRSK